MVVRRQLASGWKYATNCSYLRIMWLQCKVRMMIDVDGVKVKVKVIGHRA